MYFPRAQGTIELAAAGDAELAVSIAEVHLDRFHGDEQGLGDLGIRGAAGGSFRDASFARGERGDAASRGAGDADAACGEFFARSSADGDRAALVGEGERFSQRLA
jgi:hypothetical protein